MSIDYVAWAVLVGVGLLALAVWHLVSRTCPEARAAYLVYVISYLVTTGIGATVLTFPEGVALMAEANPSANFYVVRIRDVSTFWVAIYSPFVVPGAILALLSAWSRRRNALESGLSRATMGKVSIASFGTVAGVVIGYCAFSFLRAGKLGILSEVLRLEMDYQALVALRYEVFNQIGRIALGLIYVGLPALSFVALHRAVVGKSMAWRIIACAMVSLTFLFQLMTVQKSIAVVFIMALALALYSLRVISSWIFAAGALAAVVLLTALQQVALGEWSVVNTVALILYRMAVGAVAYVNLFPHVVSFEGIDMMLDMLGIGRASQASVIVFDYLYPGAIGVQGNAPAPAHIMAYAEAGVWYALFVLVVVGVVLRAISRIWSAELFSRDGGIRFALYMQGLVMLYYLTQTSIRDVLISSYGVVWMLLPLAGLIAFRVRFR